MSIMKTCTKCGVGKPLSEFYTRPSSRDGYRRDCKACVSSRATQWGKDNVEKRRLHSAEQRRRHPEKMKAAIHKWQRANPERRAKNALAWAKANPTKIRAATDKWQAENPERVRAWAAARLAMKLRATPAWANAAAIAAVYRKATDLTAATGVIHEVDHIVPLRGKTVRGLHVEHNLQVIPKAVNQSKGNRWWPDMP